MKFIVGEFVFYNWNTVRAFGTVLNEEDLSTAGIDVWVPVDPTIQQDLRIQTESGIVDAFNEQHSPTYGTLASNKVYFLC